MNTSAKQQEYNASTTAGFAEISVSTEFVTYNESTVYGGHNNTNITVLLSPTSSAFVSWDHVSRGGSTEVITGVIVSVVSCVVILLIVIPLIIWRCRAVQPESTCSAAGPPEPGKCSTVAFPLLHLQ